MADRLNMLPLEIWAGIECTGNRVSDRYFDQVVRSGHEDRNDDIARIAWLGVPTVRYPVLWERTAPGPLARAPSARDDLSFARALLNQCKATVRAMRAVRRRHIHLGHVARGHSRRASRGGGRR